MKYRYKLLSALAIVAAVSAPAVAQNVDPALASSWDYMQREMPGVPYELLTAACAERTVVIYQGTWSAAQQNQAQKFKETFPCMNVELFELQAGILRQRFISETQAGQHTADIIQDSDVGSLNLHVGNGYLEEYVISNDDDFSAGAKNSGFWYPLRRGMVGIAWNTDLVTPEEAARLTEWEGMFDPIWKGRGGLVGPTTGGLVLNLWYSLYRGVDEQIFEKIAEVEPRIFPGTVPSAGALASGDIDVLFGASETGLLPLWLAGAPIQWSLPEPGIGPLSGQGISANAPHPNAAKLYQEYAFSEEGYGYWQELGGAPARIGFKDRREVANEAWYVFPEEFFDFPIEEVTAANEEMGKLFEEHVVP